jgi:ornithine decarboxylase
MDKNPSTSLPEKNPHPNDVSSPHVSVLPSNVTSLIDCARYEIDALQEKQQLMEEEEDALDDGFMICDLQVVQTKLDAWYRMFPRVKPYFALKCNPDAQVAGILGASGNECGFDCASLSEVQLAKAQTSAALDISHIVYANPQRAEIDLETALQWGVSALTFDGSEELYKVDSACQKLKLVKRPEMILRIVVPDLHSSVPLGEKFGAPPSKLQELCEVALSLNLQVIGISFHCGSGCHDPNAYAQALELARGAMDICDAVFAPKKCTVLDMGGGYPGWDGIGGDMNRFSATPAVFQSTTTMDNGNEKGEGDDHADSTRAIADVVVPLLDKWFPPEEITVISEPGRYFVEAAFILASRIYKVDETFADHRHYTIGHGVQGVFKDVLLCGESFLPIPLAMNKSTNNDNEDGKTTIASTVYGPSGDALDIVCANCQLPCLQVGDWLLFDRMGAYTLSIASRTGRPVIRYVQGG